MNKPLRLVVLLWGSSVLAAEPPTLFFAKDDAHEKTYIALTIDGDQVAGTQVWQPKEKDGARGTLDGIVNGDVIQVLYSYTIEGSDQSEEEVLKIDGDKLFIGEGELVADPKDDSRMNLKEPNKVAFKTVLKKVSVTESKPGTPERKAIMDAMRGPVAKEAGSPVLFTGNVRVSGSWARFQGDVQTADGKKPKNADFSDLMELDFFALLKKNKDGTWKVVHHGFAGDISVGEEAREKYPEAPWVLFQ